MVNTKGKQMEGPCFVSNLFFKWDMWIHSSSPGNDTNAVTVSPQTVQTRKFRMKWEKKKKSPNLQTLAPKKVS